ncbi:MAG: hypothetical protein Q8M76_02970, partial [Spirochaetaceae bacterium]|nr:hypothetical protein [Spirochaetaceae bacterium]
MKPLFRIGIAALVAMQLGGAFAPLDFRAPMAAAAALILVTGFPLMTGTFRKAAAIFIALGAAMLLYSKQPPMAWIEASVSMTNIIGIVAVMQVFSVPIKLGDYDSAIRSWLDRRFTTERSLFAFTTLAAHVLTSFLNLGSIPVMVSLFEDTLMRRVSEYERFFASATTRGYVLAALWSPGAVNLFLVVQATDLSWSEVFLPGFVLAAGGMVLSYAMETKKSGVLAPAARREPLEQTAPPSHPEGPSPSDPSARSRVSHIIAVASVFVLVMALMEALRIGQKSSRMILAGALVALAWLFALRRRPGLATALKQYWSQGILKAADVAPFFVAMGIFSGALESSG